MVLGYTYDFNSVAVWRTANISLLGGGLIWGTGIWDTDTWGGSISVIKHADLDPSGQFVRFRFSNANINEEFQLDGFSVLVKPQDYN